MHAKKEGVTVPGGPDLYRTFLWQCADFIMVFADHVDEDHKVIWNVFIGHLNAKPYIYEEIRKNAHKFKEGKRTSWGYLDIRWYARRTVAEWVTAVYPPDKIPESMRGFKPYHNWKRGEA